MDTLVRQSPSDAPADPGADAPEPPAPAGGEPAVADAPARTCKACGAGMSADQDWCLNCGTARPGRLGTRAGWRAAATVSGATLLLVCGAVAASYAALTDDAGKKADQPGGGSATPIAQAPVQVPGAPSTAVPPVTTTPGAAPPATTTGGATLPGLPKLPTGSNTGVKGTPVLPPPPTSTGTTTGTSTGTTTTTTTTNTTTTGTTTTPAALQPLALGADAADIYDPYQRATAKGDPADAYDKNAGGAWFVTSAAKPMQVGLLVDLEARKNLKQIQFSTTTPGFRLEVYGTDGSALPPDILDTRWTHLASRSDVDQNTTGDNAKGDGKEIVNLRKDGEQVRQLVLWFTTPPDSGTTVRLRDLVLKG